MTYNTLGISCSGGQRERRTWVDVTRVLIGIALVWAGGGGHGIRVHLNKLVDNVVCRAWQISPITALRLLASHLFTFRHSFVRLCADELTEKKVRTYACSAHGYVFHILKPLFTLGLRR